MMPRHEDSVLRIARNIKARRYKDLADYFGVSRQRVHHKMKEAVAIDEIKEIFRKNQEPFSKKPGVIIITHNDSIILWYGSLSRRNKESLRAKLPGCSFQFEPVDNPKLECFKRRFISGAQLLSEYCEGKFPGVCLHKPSGLYRVRYGKVNLGYKKSRDEAISLIRGYIMGQIVISKEDVLSRLSKLNGWVSILEKLYPDGESCESGENLILRLFRGINGWLDILQEMYPETDQTEELWFYILDEGAHIEINQIPEKFRTDKNLAAWISCDISRLDNVPKEYWTPGLKEAAHKVLDNLIEWAESLEDCLALKECAKNYFKDPSHKGIVIPIASLKAA